MSLATALGQILNDVVKGKRQVIVNLSGADSGLTIKLVTSLLQDAGCCDSIDSTHNQCVVRVKRGQFPAASKACLKRYQSSVNTPAINGTPIQFYIHNHRGRHESEILETLLTDGCAPYLLDIFSHFCELETDHPSLPYHCTNITLTDMRGSFLLVTYSKSAAHGSSDALEAFQEAKRAAAASVSRFRDTHPHAAVVLAAAYHDKLKLNLLEDTQPEALTVIQTLTLLQQQRQADTQGSRSGLSSSHIPGAVAAAATSELTSHPTYSDTSEERCGRGGGRPGRCQVQAQDVVIPAVIAAVGAAAFFLIRSVTGKRSD